MRTGAQKILPLVQTTVAIAFTAIHHLQRDLMPAWVRPDLTLPDALTAPAALVRLGFDLLRKVVWSMGLGTPSYYDAAINIVFCGLVWLVWYGVSIEMGGKGRSVLMPRTRMRILGDIAAVILAPALLLPLVGQYPLSRTFGFVIAAIYLSWVIAIIGFYGRDLFLYLRDARSQAALRKQHT